MEDDEPMSEEDTFADENAFEVYLAEAGYAPDDEVEEQDAVDILLTWKQTRQESIKPSWRVLGASQNSTGKDFKKLL